jgi:hypothetical protein
MSAVRGPAAGEAGLTDADFKGCRWIEGEPAPVAPWHVLLRADAVGLMVQSASKDRVEL